jgi:hypothetical protein
MHVPVEERAWANPHEQSQSLLVCSVVRGEVAHLYGSKGGHDTGEASAPPRDDTYILKAVLRLFPLSIKVIVIFGNLFSQFTYSSSRCIFQLSVLR